MRVIVLCECCMLCRETNGEPCPCGVRECDCAPSCKQHPVPCAEGLTALGPHLVPDWDSETGRGFDEFSFSRCESCGSHLGGARYQYAVLGA